MHTYTAQRCGLAAGPREAGDGGRRGQREGCKYVCTPNLPTNIIPTEIA